MASKYSNTLYITFVDVDCNLLKIWGQKNRISASYIEKQLSQLIPELNNNQSLNPSLIFKGMLCYAKLSENYYRARIISNVQGESVGVFFVDYGYRNVIHVSHIKIREGTEDVVLKMAEQVDEFYLARVIAPANGWTSEIISAIRKLICNEELPYGEIAQIEGRKFIEIQFQNEDLSNYLAVKKIAQGILFHLQTQMIISNIQQVSNEELISHQNEGFNLMVPSSLSSSRRFGGKPSLQEINAAKDSPLRSNHINSTHLVNFSQVHFPQQISSRFSSLGMNSNKNNIAEPSFNLPRSSFINQNFQSNKMLLDSSLSSHYSLPHLGKSKPGQLFNNGMIEALAQKIKQFIAEENTKLASNEENIPHNYVSNVLKVGSTYNIFISCVDDGPWSFSVQLVSCEDELNKLMDDLTFVELIPVKPPIVLGHACIAASAIYGNLCRGVVISISHSAANIHLVDFGDTESLPTSAIYELPQKFFKTRVLSQKFCLTGLQSVPYSDEIKEYFKQVVQDKLLILKVASLEGDNLPTCELYIESKNIKRLLNEKIQMARAVSNDSVLKVGDVENVVVTWVVTPQRFYVQLQKRDLELNGLKNELSLIETEGEKITMDEVYIGLQCVCKFMEDEQWYRAKITSISSEKSITVFYVDYGNTEVVDISLLRKIKNNGLIARMNNQAIQCCLQGFEFKPCDQELCYELENLTLEKNFQMTVVSVHEDQLCVKLFAGDEDITQILMKPADKRLNSVKNNSNLQKDNCTSENTSQYTLSHVSDGVSGREKNYVSDGVNGREKSYVSSTTKARFEKEGNWRTHMRKFNDELNNFQKNEKLNKGLKQNKESRFREPNYESSSNLSPKYQNSREKRLNVDDDKYRWNEKSSKRGAKKLIGRENYELNSDKKLEESRSGKRGITENEPNEFNNSVKNFDTKNEFRSSLTGNSEENSKKSIPEEDLAPTFARYKEKVVNIGNSERAVITYYINPNEFYIQVLSDEEEFKEMMQNIQIYYSDKYSVKHQPKEGDIIVALFSFDDILYRGEVVKSNPLTVRYVDYGNQEEIEQSRSWMVAKQFISLPKQAIRCKLANLNPIEEQWPPLGSKLDNFFNSEEYKCTFFNYIDDTYEVELETLDGGKKLSAEIIASGFGVPQHQPSIIQKIDFSLLPCQVLRVKVSAVESFKKFFVLLNPNFLEKLNEEMILLSEKKEQLKPIEKSSLQEGTLCLVMQEDKSWSRGRIVEINENEILVQLIDYGITIESNINKVKFLPDHVLKIEPQAIECCLKDSCESYSREDLKDLIELKFILISIISEFNKRLLVDVFDENGKELFPQKTNHSQSINPIGQLPITMQKMPILIAHVESPDVIYIQKSTDQKNFMAFSDKLNNFYDKESSCAKFDGCEGDLVAVKTSDDTWCRGRVIRFISEGVVDVFYIDIGKRENLSCKSIRKLDPSFYSFNAFVREVSLGVDLFLESQEKVYEKLEALKDERNLIGYFINEGGKIILEILHDGLPVIQSLIPKEFATLRSEKFKKKIVSIGSPQSAAAAEIDNLNQGMDSLRVFVIHIDNPNKFWIHKENSISEFQKFQETLQNACKTLPEEKNPKEGDVVGAIFCDVWYRALILNSAKSLLTVKFIDYGNIVEVDLNHESVKQLPVDLKEIPLFTSQFSLKGNWKESATAKFEDIILQYEDPVTAIILEKGDPVIVDLLKDGHSITQVLIEAGEAVDGDDFDTVYITHINSPCDFYIQKHSAIKMLEIITRELSQFDVTEVALAAIRKDEIYAAKFLEDDLWYRAKVLENSENRIQVFFIDYGNVSYVTEVANLPNDLIGIPSLAENCSLLLGKKCDVWSEEACKIFENYADGRPLKMKTILERKEKSIVALFSEDQDLSEELAKVSEEDGRFEAYVSYFNSLNDFYLKLARDEQMDLIKNYLQNLKEVEELSDKKPETLCLVGPFSDEFIWHRAKILQNFNENCEVLLIDQGKTLITSELLKMNEKNIIEIPPRALRCSLPLANKNISEVMEEKFIELAYKSHTILRARIINPGDLNIVSLKLDGQILEEILAVNNVDCQKPETDVNYTKDSNEAEPFMGLEEVTDDNKNSMKMLMEEKYVSKTSENGITFGECLQNETDEEKQIKIGFGTGDGGSEGFRSDDEKEISGLLSSNHVNITDNELKELKERPEIAFHEISGDFQNPLSVKEIVDLNENESITTTESNGMLPEAGSIEEELTSEDVDRIITPERVTDEDKSDN